MGNWTEEIPRIALVGAGRLGTALASALSGAGLEVDGPHGRGFDGAGAGVVLLCVPDAEIPAAAAAVAAGPLVGHCSGATGLDAIGAHEAFGLHPLMTVPASGGGFRGAACAVAGSTPRALELARELAARLGMRAFEIADADRAAYHAAASIASNLLLALEAGAEQLAASAAVPREALAPLVRATVDNWAREGAERALTGPIARGDQATVARQREAVAERAPELLALFDAAGARARLLAGRAAAGEPALLRTVAELRAAVAQARGQARSVALVPTMGALHEGHLSLIGRARAEHGLVVVSAFVNPAQFDDAGDLAAYPRDEARDAELAFAAGADVLFAPSAQAIYPDGFSTTVSVGGALTGSLEGEHRGRPHFDGVTTVVAKLLAMATPDAAYFGQKDAQQAAVVRRMARDLELPCAIVVCPTVRDADGLALSSRNARLSQPERERALSLSRALTTVAAEIAAGRIATAAAASDAGLAILREGGAEPEYFAAVDPATFAPAAELRGEILLLTAARVGDVRLIDNLAATAPRTNGPNEAATALAAPTTG